jgi:4-amino-4-deoxy-L-arabinose transferase-like glycosyltransferase
MIHVKLRLACWTAAAIVVWLVILPWVAARPDMQRRIEFLEQRRIDPSAMFYTEVESMNEVRQRMAQRRQQHPAPFWSPFQPRSR